jgi:hypothetical protein
MSSLQKGPNSSTVADGFSLSDERQAVSGPDINYDYDESPNEAPLTAEQAGVDNHLANPDDPKLHQTHQGEHRGDFGTVPVKASSKVYLWVLCASLNSCNLGYDIGVNTGAGPLIQEDFGLSDIQIEMFFGSINLFAMVGALGAFYVSDSFGRRHAFVVSAVIAFRCFFLRTTR